MCVSGKGQGLNSVNHVSGDRVDTFGLTCQVDVGTTDTRDPYSEGQRPGVKGRDILPDYDKDGVSDHPKSGVWGRVVARQQCVNLWGFGQPFVNWEALGNVQRCWVVSCTSTWPTLRKTRDGHKQSVGSALRANYMSYSPRDFWGGRWSIHKIFANGKIIQEHKNRLETKYNVSIYLPIATSLIEELPSHLNVSLTFLLIYSRHSQRTERRSTILHSRTTFAFGRTFTKRPTNRLDPVPR